MLLCVLAVVLVLLASPWWWVALVLGLMFTVIGMGAG